VVWHIVEDPAIRDQFPPPGDATRGEWGRLGVRLLAVLSGPGQSASLSYADGTATGITVTAQSGPQEFLNTEIARI
jgi:hypothetical protein